MKSTSIIILAALIGATTFAGCKKEDSTSNLNATNLNAAAPKIISGSQNGLMSAVNYQFRFDAGSAQGAFTAIKGHFSVGEIWLMGEASSGVPQNITPVSFFKAVKVQVPLFETTNLGWLDIGNGTYQNMNFQVKLNTNNGPAIIIDGIYDNKGIPLNVQLIVDQDITLKGVLAGPIRVSDIRYMASLTLNADEIAKGFDPSLIDNLPIGNGNVIIISAQSNPQLYQAIVAAIQAAPLHAQFTSLFTPNDRAVSISAAQ